MGELLTSNTSGILTSRTVWVFLILLIGSILNQMGVVSLELNEQANWLLTALSVVGLILRMITKKPVWEDKMQDFK